jgi:hypothetical protein
MPSLYDARINWMPFQYFYGLAFANEQIRTLAHPTDQVSREASITEIGPATLPRARRTWLVSEAGI